jgi:hypothetical protein
MAKRARAHTDISRPYFESRPDVHVDILQFLEGYLPEAGHTVNRLLEICQAGHVEEAAILVEIMTAIRKCGSGKVLPA